jgi:redox-sensing transcriptional repressor
MADQKLPSAPSIRRLPGYLTIIRQALKDGLEYISGTVIAQELNVEPIQVRKDLAITGIAGKPKKGYPIKDLIHSIESFLGWDADRNAVLVGAGNLGSALIGYREFRLHGLIVAAAFDTNPAKVGKRIHSVPIYDASEMADRIRELGVKLAILTVPSSEAQATADVLVGAGIEAIWNFTNTKLRVPDSVAVQREDLSSGYALLCVKSRRKPI